MAPPLSKFLSLISCLGIIFVPILVGCETDSFVDPSRTGYFETTPSAMPILGRIDVIEQVSDEPDIVKPTLADLIPENIPYTFAAGDVLRIQIPSLMATGQTEVAERVVDQSGDIQLPVINKIRAAGKTIKELQDDIEERLKGVITNPQAFVALQEGRAFQYRVLGSVDQPGIFALSKPDFRLLDAIANARGASVNTTRILITRTELANDYKAEYDRKETTPKKDTSTAEPQKQVPTTSAVAPTTSVPNPAPPTAAPSTDEAIDKLINELPSATTDSSAAATIAPAPAPTSEPAATPAPTPEPAATPEPTPEPAATIAPTPEPTATPAPTPEPAATPAPTPEPTATPAPTPEPAATPAPTPEPAATPAPTPEPAATPEPTPAATPAPTPEPEPASEPEPVPATDPVAEPSTQPATSPTTPSPNPTKDPTADPSKRKTQLGMLRAANRQAPPVDIDQLEPAKSDDLPSGNSNASASQNNSNTNASNDYAYIQKSRQWVPKSSITNQDQQIEAATPAATNTGSAKTNQEIKDVAVTGNSGSSSAEAAKPRNQKRSTSAQKTKVIEIDYNQLVRGKSDFNIIIRPGDIIYCDSGEVGVVYIDGEISRPGVYNLPTAGRLTLSRLVAAAGGVSELAIPERCDLIRRLSSDKEACVRISLLAIRNRSEPDLFLKKDDHIIVGTNFWALPLARFRRDLSFPNSVGFQLDRNFGNDVFGAPPSGITTN